MFLKSFRRNKPVCISTPFLGGGKNDKLLNLKWVNFLLLEDLLSSCWEMWFPQLQSRSQILNYRPFCHKPDSLTSRLLSARTDHAEQVHYFPTQFYPKQKSTWYQRGAWEQNVTKWDVILSPRRSTPSRCVPQMLRACGCLSCTYTQDELQQPLKVQHVTL